MADEPIQGGLADSIAMLEQILEVMPQDEDAIKALYNAYAQGGHNERAFEYLGRLVDVVSSGGSADALAFVQKELPRFESEFPSKVSAQIARLRTLSGAVAAAQMPTVAKGVPASARSAETAKPEADISEELALAWRLYEEGQLTQEEYSSVLHDLTEVSSKEVDVPVTVLHVLNDRGFTQMTRIMNYLSTRSGVPFMSLSNYELSEQVASVLPIDVSSRDGALPFALLGNDLLVGVLNPFNNMLVDKVEKESGHHCHTYLVDPDDYDATLDRLRGLAKSSEGEG
ncbi:MAG: hypothetical protein OES84_01900 [Kiritimatiellaceae bacterium]|nr:hypothetical protein [Kiritimatiellaceae bacterium]